MEQVKKRILTTIKILTIVLFVLMFLTLGLIVMNNTLKNMTGGSFRLFSHSNGFVIDLYGSSYLIDFTPLQQAKAWCEQNWIFVPKFVRIIQYITELL